MEKVTLLRLVSAAALGVYPVPSAFADFDRGSALTFIDQQLTKRFSEPAPFAFDWEDGFIPGAMWAMFEADPVANAHYFAEARRWTEGLIPGLPGFTPPFYEPRDHDLGFVYPVAFGSGYEHLEPGVMRDGYETVLLDTAVQLDRRFDDRYGAVKSWNFFPPDEEPVIIDSMMTIQGLTWSALNGGPSSHLGHALEHAKSVIAYHLQPAGGFGSGVGRYAVHVVDMAPLIEGETPEISDRFFQSRSFDSPWARGQGWAIEGFARLYEETSGRAEAAERAALLAAAQDVADFFLDQTTDHAVPYWDFAVVTDPAAPGYDPDELRRDSSSGAAAAAGLLRLSCVSPDPADRARYHDAAEQLLETLTDEYLNLNADADDATLLTDVVDYYTGGIFGPRDYADYYYVRAVSDFRDLLPGDTNADGIVDQGDLDRVLQNWGVDTDATGVPAGWTHDWPAGQIDQSELDRVLQNWGDTAAPDSGGATLPEPLVGGLTLLPVLARSRRGVRR